MFTRDGAAIAAHGLASPDGLVDVVEFVLCTIQAGLSTVKAQRVDIAENGLQSRFLWGKKADGLEYTRTNKKRLWAQVVAIVEDGRETVDQCADAIQLFMKVPNLGMVKAAFVAQCLGFNVACIDSHNLKRLGMKPGAVKISPKLKPATARTKIAEYVQMTQVEGSEYWWNSWCEYVAGNTANRSLATGDEVSRYHTEAVIIRGH